MAKTQLVAITPIGLVLMAGVITLVVATQPTASRDQHTGHGVIASAQQYTCPMHPEIVRDRAGKCPICQMSLVLMEPDGDQSVMAHDGMVMPPAAGWADPNIPISPPPPLMGMQMGQVDTIGVPPLGYEMDGNVKVFRLIAQPVEQVFSTGDTDSEVLRREMANVTGITHTHLVEQKVRLWGYNGNSPGPTIEVNEGDRIRILFKNELPEPTSIHWHGIELPNAQDGAGGLTQAPVPPGGTFVYEYTLYQSGTFLYHSGFNMMKQDDFGLHGFLVVRPRKPAHTVDRDIAIMLGVWAFHPGNPYPNLATMDFNWFTFNGKVAPDIPMITVKQGERVRIRFGNIIMMSHPIHLHGFTWKVVGTEGGPIPESAQWPGNTIDVAPGTTRDVEFVAWNPGYWRLHCHKLHHIMNAHAEVPLGVMGHGGMFTLVHVIPKDADAPWRHPREEEFTQ